MKRFGHFDCVSIANKNSLQLSQNPHDHPSSALGRRMTVDSKFGYPPKQTDEQALYGTKPTMPSIYGQGGIPQLPDLPPRVDRASKPPSTMLPPTSTPTSSLPSKSSLSVNSGGTLGRSAHDRLFDTSAKSMDDQQEHDLYTSSNKLLNTLESTKKLPSNGNSLERRDIVHGHHHSNLQNSLDRQNSVPKNGYDSVSSYESFNTNPNQTQQSMNSTMSARLGPNAPDDLKSIPGVTNRASIANSQDYTTASLHRNQMSHDRVDYVTNGNIHNGNGVPQRPTNLLIESPRKPAHIETKSDYSKYSR